MTLTQSPLALAQRRAVVADEHELALARAERLDGRPVAERVLARLDGQREARVDALTGLLSFLGGHCPSFYRCSSTGIAVGCGG